MSFIKDEEYWFLSVQKQVVSQLLRKIATSRIFPVNFIFFLFSNHCREIVNILIYLNKNSEIYPWTMEQKSFVWSHITKLFGLKNFDRFWPTDDILSFQLVIKVLDGEEPIPTIFTCSMSFKVLDQLENQTPVSKCVEIELSSVSCLNNLDELRFHSVFT